MQDHELDAWLNHEPIDIQQRAALHRIHDMVAARWPDDDLTDTREQAFTAAAMVILGDTEWTEATEAWKAARRAYMDAQAAMTGAVMVAADWLGMSQTRVAVESGLARDTVRKALGK